MSVGYRIKEIHIKHGLSREYINTNSELNVSRLESGKVNISLVSLSIPCNLYSIPPKKF